MVLDSTDYITPDLDDLMAWQYDLPPELIASRPAERRDGSRLMVVDRKAGTIAHRRISDLPQFLNPGDLMVFNNTKVVPARMFGVRSSTGGKWEGLFIEETRDGDWHILCETRGRLLPGEDIRVVAPYEPTEVVGQMQPSMTLTLIRKQSDGSWIVRPSGASTAGVGSSGVGSAFEVLEQFGSLPLPPYMGRKLADADDQDRYQTQFASEPGAIAAPTAGLHFTPELLEQCQLAGAELAHVTLHVGIGTFRPVTVSRLSEHQMHDEWCRLTDDVCSRIQSARRSGGRLLAVGTTSVRTLESASRVSGTTSESPAQMDAASRQIQPWSGRTNLFIRPGFQFQVVDCLLTNFHLPGSTLIVLVAALAGYDLIMKAYREAVRERYRFFSYGDAMLIL
ncbi:MAG: tRNA preQ1(34) S-adenosylmethionine ribosyltransferase-isomerase QueA [Planctomyces sp.]|nr:tRNA preQ1(34) S-adenosylmethionine ribosyltransferase-isomerase QueA [Planctomyces sp.]